MILLWAGFLLLVFLLPALDLGFFNRTPHVVFSKEALGWTAVWIVLSLLFNALIYPSTASTGSASGLRRATSRAARRRPSDF